MTIAFVLGGGGSLGAFSVGVARWLLVDKAIQPDIVTGTSTGAIASVLVATGEIGLLSDLYTNVTTQDVLHLRVAAEGEHTRNQPAPAQPLGTGADPHRR